MGIGHRNWALGIGHRSLGIGIWRWALGIGPSGIADLDGAGAHHDASWMEVAVAECEAIEGVEGVAQVLGLELLHLARVRVRVRVMVVVMARARVRG